MAKHGRLDEALRLSKAVVNGPRAVRNPEFYRLVMHCYVQLLLELPNDDEQIEKLGDYFSSRESVGGNDK